jgi:signal transduction histidine kinase
MDEAAAESELTREDLIHDLNNVFETITEAADLLAADRRWKALAATLIRSVTRGKRLLGAIPDSSPNLSAIVAAATQYVTDYCIASRKPRMRFVSEVPADMKLPGSTQDWERVFVNLFLNAAQIMKKPGRIDIGTRTVEGHLNITISDSGPGIPEDILPRMFRTNVSTKVSRNARTGLGLHIVAAIVRKYDGSILAANRERGTGAVFTISLPSA